MTDALEDGTNVTVVATFTGDHLRMVATRLNMIAAELDTGLKHWCCGDGVSVLPMPQDDGGEGVEIRMHLHFADVVGHRH